MLRRPRVRVGAALVAAAALVLVAWTAVGPTSAAWSNQTNLAAAATSSLWLVQITDQHGKCLDVRNRTWADANAVQIYTCNRTPAQKWLIMADGTIRANGWCLAVPGSATTNGTGLQIKTCTTGASMRWVVDRSTTTAPWLRFRSALSWTPSTAAGGCVLVPGGTTTDATQVQISTCTSPNTNQDWQLTAWDWADAA
ncbi:MAG: RICIN domain-containing protein [Cellulomonas sp.]